MTQVDRMIDQLIDSEKSFIIFHIHPSEDTRTAEYISTIQRNGTEIEYCIEGHGIGRNIYQINNEVELKKIIENDFNRFSSGSEKLTFEYL